MFKKRKTTDKINSVSTTVQEETSKDYMNKEVQDLTNNYKSASASKKLHEQNIALRDEYLQSDSEKDGIYYAQ